MSLTTLLQPIIFTSSAAFTESGEAVAAQGALVFASTAALTEGGEAIAAVGSEVFSSTAALTESGESLEAEANTPVPMVLDWTAGGVLGEYHLTKSKVELVESGESFSAKGMVVMPETKGAREIEEFMDEEILTLFAMAEL